MDGFECRVCGLVFAYATLRHVHMRDVHGLIPMAR